MERLLIPLLDGLSGGAVLFLIAVGLTLTYGIMKVLNFSHGGFFMLGAFFSYTIGVGRIGSPAVLLAVILLGAGATSVVGALAEAVLFRRLYQFPELYSLLGTYALLLTLEGSGSLFWGVAPVSLGQAPQFARPVYIGQVGIPTYDLVLVGVGCVVFAGVHILVNRTGFGRVVRATAADREMAATLGINVTRVFFIMFCVGIFLAGLGGGLIAPLISVTPDIAATYVIEAFAIVVVGGLGSVTGSFLAAMMLGIVNAFLVAFQPGLAQFSLYIAMGLILMFRPQGLLGHHVPDLV